MDVKHSRTHNLYQPEAIESRWQEKWYSKGIYKTKDTTESPKFYCLDYFPYPSGEGLHMGHCRNYVPTDVISRYKRMKGFNVLHPMGWDAFGEPTEHHAILKGISPRESTDKNTANFKRQLKMLGTSYDWDREIDSSSPEYYRWTQWIFLRMFNRGLVYYDKSWQWWCPTCSTTLSNNEINGDRCWRGHEGVTKKEIPAWFFKITNYSDELLSDLNEIDWPEPVKKTQRNWIGRSEGVEVFWKLHPGDKGECDKNIQIGTFTTRVETISGVSFLAVAPEHPFVMKFTSESIKEAVKVYIQQSIKFPDFERTAQKREVTGVFSGAYAYHPMTQEKIPIFVADYVLPTYGNGAVMGVPAHDRRDFHFAKKFGLEIKEVILYSSQVNRKMTTREEEKSESTRMVNSGFYDGMEPGRAQKEITEWLESTGRGRRTVNTHLRDWLISRQRYWGTPIPVVHCDYCGIVPVAESDLPVELPKMLHYTADQDVKSPLDKVESFVSTNCPDCGRPAKRETDTMGGFACSSWYFLRFTNPKTVDKPFEPKAVKFWMPVDLYVGGAEHAVLHLLYARFWTKFLADEGLIGIREPFTKLINQGQLHGVDGQRMSKSRGNVIVPDPYINRYGADALRIHCLFLAPFDQSVDWQENGIIGSRRFLNKVWSLVHNFVIDRQNEIGENPNQVASDDIIGMNQKLQGIINLAIRNVTERIEEFRFNTMVSCLMEFVNQLSEFEKKDIWRTKVYKDGLETLLILLSPSAPHITEELWKKLGKPFSIHQQPWPTIDQTWTAADVSQIPVQINGRVKSYIYLENIAGKEEAIEEALSNPDIRNALDSEIIRSIFVPGKILNIVTK